MQWILHCMTGYSTIVMKKRSGNFSVKCIDIKMIQKEYIDTIHLTSAVKTHENYAW